MSQYSCASNSPPGPIPGSSQGPAHTKFCPPPPPFTLAPHPALPVLRKWITSVPPPSSYTQYICAVSGEPILALQGQNQALGAEMITSPTPGGVVPGALHPYRHTHTHPLGCSGWGLWDRARGPWLFPRSSSTWSQAPGGIGGLLCWPVWVGEEGSGPHILTSG